MFALSRHIRPLSGGLAERLPLFHRSLKLAPFSIFAAHVATQAVQPQQ
jgi:hypothetical protein